MQATRLQFGRHILDVDRGCLLRDEEEVQLRPKTFAVLRHLVENHGRLVSKDELFSAVWPNVTVTDDALVQSVGELRRALKDDGSQLIKTIPRRGYRFDADVSVANPPDEVIAGTPASGRLLRVRPHLVAVAMLALLLGAAASWFGIDMLRRTSLAVAKPAIAILPIVDQSSDPAREYFADGLTQDIISALGRFPELTVMSWNAVSPFKSKPTDPREIASSLAVRYQVEGAMVRKADRVRVTVRLVGAEGRVLWSERYDEPLTGLFALEDRITSEIAGALAIRVAESERRRVLAKPTESLEAYDYVLRARPALQRPTRAAVVEAREALEHAIKLDPNYASAYAALAETYYVATSMGWAEAPATSLGQAEEMANKALSLDESEVRAHVILGRIHVVYRRYDQAKAEMDRAVAINPNDAHGIAGRGNVEMWLGKTDAAIASLEMARRLDPELSTMDRFALSLAYYLKGRYEEAIAEAETNLRRSPGASFSRVLLAAAYAQNGQTEDAARVAGMIHRLDVTFDPQEFGTKFLKPADLDHLRDGLRKAALYEVPPRQPASATSR
ncbi:MAG: winged helix-turn-helix domain-containing protein [Proteobacteria bacterium]|nr:winged helix-turn-helix domain-containing protein [Pseudomonadota bacterium]